MNPEASFIIGNVTGMAAAIAKDVYRYYFGGSKGKVMLNQSDVTSEQLLICLELANSLVIANENKAPMKTCKTCEWDGM